MPLSRTSPARALRGLRGGVARWVLGGAAMLAAAPWSAAEAAPELRVAAHAENGGFGRMVFDFNHRVGWVAAVSKDALTIHFDAAMPGAPQKIASSLGSWVSRVDQSADKQTLTISLRSGLGIKAFVNPAGAVVIDVTATANGGRPGPYGPLPASSLPASSAPSVSGAAAAPAATASSAAQASASPPTPLAKPAPVSPGPIVPVTPLTSTAAPPAAPVPAVTAALPPVPTTPNPPTPNPPVPTTPNLPAPKPVAAPAVTPPQAVAAASSAAAAEAASASDTPAPDVQTVSLAFPATGPTAAAVFERAGYLWVVFDRPSNTDVAALKKASAGVVTFAEQRPDSASTVIRMIVTPGYHPSVRRDGASWVVDLMRQPYHPAQEITAEPQLRSAGGPRLYVPVAGASRALTVVDPDLGDQFIVVPTTEASTGVWPPRGTVDVDVPSTVTGVVVEPHADQVAVDVSSDGVAISAPGGLVLSPSLAAAAVPEITPKDTITRVLAISAWAHGGGRDYQATRDALDEAAAMLPDQERDPARLDLARFLFANGRSAEALGVMRVVAKDHPDTENTAAFRALRGAANLMMGRDAEAIVDFSHPSLAGVDEATFWRALAQARVGDAALQDPILKANASVLIGYPRWVRVPLAIEAARATSLADDAGATQSFIDAARAPDNTTHEKAAIRYYEGVIAAGAKQTDDALSDWDEVARGTDREFGALASRDQLEMLYRLRKIDRPTLLRGLETLRYAWRGGAFEFDLLMRIGQLYAENLQYDEAMRVWKKVSEYYKGNDKATQAIGHMQETFNQLFGAGGADNLSPIKAIALFDEFRDLIPAGAPGDQMISSLANRLVSVDLLPQAAQLLDRQITYRLQGVDRARVGARLALVYLLDQKPDLALEAILRSKDPGIPPDLDRQRQQLLARGMADLGRTDDALAVISDDDTRDADLLRAEINWRAARWKPAAAALTKLVPPPSSTLVLTDDQASTLLDLGAALTLAGDEQGVAQARRNYLDAMNKTAYGNPFDLVTTPPSAGLIDYRTVTSRVKQAEDFKSFLATYKERLLAAGLGGIN